MNPWKRSFVFIFPEQSNGCPDSYGRKELIHLMYVCFSISWDTSLLTSTEIWSWGFPKQFTKSFKGIITGSFELLDKRVGWDNLYSFSPEINSRKGEENTGKIIDEMNVKKVIVFILIWNDILGIIKWKK